jgi:hypothetical protein
MVSAEKLRSVYRCSLVVCLFFSVALIVPASVALRQQGTLFREIMSLVATIYLGVILTAYSIATVVTPRVHRRICIWFLVVQISIGMILLIITRLTKFDTLPYILAISVGNLVMTILTLWIDKKMGDADDLWQSLEPYTPYTPLDTAKNHGDTLRQ